MARVHPDDSRKTMEEVLEETGWGLYYRVLIGVTSACAFCQAAAMLSVTFALPLGTCDILKNEISILTVDISFFFGRAIGGLFLNACSDICGRLWFLPNSLMIMFGSNFLAAFSHSGTALSVAMFILGSGLEVNTRASKIHLAEILPKNKRGFYFTIPSFFWTVGYVAMIGCAWKLSQQGVVDHRGTDMRLTAWRLIFAISGGLNIVVACVTALVQPSPRYQLFKKQYNLANSSLKLFYSINKSKYSETWPLNDQDYADIISDYQINNDVEPSNCGDQICLLLRRIIRTSCLLFKRRFIANTFTLITMKVLLCSGIIPIHILATRTIMSRDKSNFEINGHDMLHLHPPLTRSCIFKADTMLFIYFITLSINILAGQIMVSFWVDRIGRQLTTTIGLLISFMSAIMLALDMQVFIWKENEVYVRAALCSILMIGYSMVLHTLELIEIESFPTAARGTAAGIINFYPNFMLCIVCLLWSTSGQITFIVLGFILASGIAAGYYLPEMRGRPMVE